MYNYCIRIRTVQSEWINQDVCLIQEFERQDSSNSKLTPIKTRELGFLAEDKFSVDNGAVCLEMQQFRHEADHLALSTAKVKLYLHILHGFVLS